MLLSFALLAVLSGAGVFVFYYVRFSRMIDARLSGDVFDSASLVLSAPTELRVGQAITPEEVAARLRKALYPEDREDSPIGTYRLIADGLEIHPGPKSYFAMPGQRQSPAAIVFRNGRVASITGLDRRRALESYRLEPEVITTLFDRSRTKRRLVRYQDLPPALVNAILATEDHRFFSHHGINFFRLIAAVATGVRTDERIRGTSTLTMQLSRNLFLTRERSLERKAQEIFLTLLLEQRLTKEEIFELYANEIYLGQRGSFSIHGVGEAASAYFNKDVAGLTLPEGALLAAIIAGPSLYSPYRYPERAVERRNFVIRRMLEVGYITAEEAERAAAAPLGLAPRNVEGNQAPFFMDMVRDRLLAQFSERDLVSESFRVYTTLDLDLQRAASEAVRVGMAEVDDQLIKRGRKKPDEEPLQPQVALVALHPRTGEIRALVGGRDYGASQLNHVLAKRQPGSSFKPFVYAAALSTGVEGAPLVVTPSTPLMDEPTTFLFGDQPYEPENYKQEYHGVVTLRQALAHSLNVATVRLAEMVGYDKVRNLAVAAGINRDLMATPAIALGAYVATPLEIASAYTIFANEGRYVGPRFIHGVRDHAGETLYSSPLETRQVLDPRVAYLMVSLLETVVTSGTGAGVRSRGFQLPCAGKTGTSHDGWFVGFTPELVTAVWVGYDDDRELKLSGAYSALPIWTEFMKRAAEIPAYGEGKWYEPPPGIVTAPIDRQTNLLASADLPTAYQEFFIEGTVPARDRDGGAPGILGRLFQVFKPDRAPTTPVSVTTARPQPPASSTDDDELSAASEKPEEAAQQKKKGGILRKFVSIFKGGSEESKPPPAEDSRP